MGTLSTVFCHGIYVASSVVTNTSIIYIRIFLIVIADVMTIPMVLGLRFRLWFRRSDLLPKRELRDK